MTGAEGPLKVRGSQASDSKEALCGKQPTILFAGSISSLIFLFLLLLSKKIRKYKNILDKTIRGTKIFKSNIGQKRDTFWAKCDTILPTSKTQQKNFEVKIGCLLTLPKTCHVVDIVTRFLTLKNFSKLNFMSSRHCQIVTRWPKCDTISGQEIF